MNEILNEKDIALILAGKQQTLLACDAFILWLFLAV
jgi:hypothetical protein